MTATTTALAAAQAALALAVLWMWRRQRITQGELRRVRRSLDLASGEAGRAKELRRALRTLRQVEPLANLYSMVAPDRRLPHQFSWGASPDVVLALVEFIRTRRPSLVIECGSGWSTLWLGLALQRFDVSGRVVALEHEGKYAKATSAMLEEQDLTYLAEVRCAPLETIEIEGEAWRWYDRRAWADLKDCGLLFVDGPPGKIQPLARFPALPLLRHCLLEDCVVVLDDGGRPDEREILTRWRGIDPALVPAEAPLAKGAAILIRRRESA